MSKYKDQLCHGLIRVYLPNQATCVGKGRLVVIDKYNGTKIYGTLKVDG